MEMDKWRLPRLTFLQWIGGFVVSIGVVVGALSGDMMARHPVAGWLVVAVLGLSSAGCLIGMFTATDAWDRGYARGREDERRAAAEAPERRWALFLADRIRAAIEAKKAGAGGRAAFDEFAALSAAKAAEDLSAEHLKRFRALIEDCDTLDGFVMDARRELLKEEDSP